MLELMFIFLDTTKASINEENLSKEMEFIIQSLMDVFNKNKFKIINKNN